MRHHSVDCGQAATIATVLAKLLFFYCSATTITTTSDGAEENDGDTDSSSNCRWRFAQTFLESGKDDRKD